ncbi:MAG: hypothetical protein PW792_09120 [Acidobacteriaceae bacterium]|nr:hypothetical protein [Acidobacteriaceae bacterium]
MQHSAIATNKRPTLHLVPPRAPRYSPIVLWHLLSLDAPTVAAVWTLLVAHAAHIHLPWQTPVALFVAVWALYVVDRLLDTTDLEERHRFHQRHRGRFLALVAWAAPVIALLLHRIDAAALRLYILLASLLAAWFIVIHARHGAHRLPKELAVGLFFPAAIFIPTVARFPDLRLTLLPPALLLAVVCTLNCLFLYAWEHPHNRLRAHWTTRWATAHLDMLSMVALGVSVVLGVFYREDLRIIPVACGLAVGFLLLLDRTRHTLRPLVVRALADAALLSPLLFLPFLHNAGL